MGLLGSRVQRNPYTNQLNVGGALPPAGTSNGQFNLGTSYGGGGQSTPSGPATESYQPLAKQSAVSPTGMQMSVQGPTQGGVNIGTASNFSGPQAPQRAPFDPNDPNNAALAGYMSGASR